MRTVIQTPPAWAPVDPELLALLTRELGPHDYAFVAAGHGRVYCRAGRTLFIKIVPRSDAALLRRSESIARFLAHRGVPAPACLPGFPRTTDDGREIFVYPYIDGGHPGESRETVQGIARAVGHLHRTLREYPEALNVARRQAAVRRWYRRKAMRVLADVRWAPGKLAVVREQVKVWLAADEALAGDALQVIHNDLHPGNLLYDSSRTVWFLDFEESTWSFLPAYFDVAKVIERFVLPSAATEADFRDLAGSIVTEYGEPIARGRILNGLRWALGFAWLRLAPLLYDENTTDTDAEVRKFLRLGELLEERHSWLVEL